MFKMFKPKKTNRKLNGGGLKIKRLESRIDDLEKQIEGIMEDNGHITMQLNANVNGYRLLEEKIKTIRVMIGIDEPEEEHDIDES